jgi:copper(I)-binding protein
VSALKATTAVAALAAGAALVLSGCGAGQISQTASQVAAVNGNSANVGKVSLRNVRILLPASEEYTNAKGGKAVLAFSAVNGNGSNPDELTSITTDLGQVRISPATPELPPLQTLVAAGPEAGHAAATPAASTTTSSTASATPTAGAAAGSTPATSSGATAAAKPSAEANTDNRTVLVEITGLTKDVTPGLTYPVTFNFKDNGTVLVNVPVDAGASNDQAAEHH